MTRVRIPAPLSTSGWPATVALSSSFTPPTSSASAGALSRSASAMHESRRTIDPKLERVGELRRKNLHARRVAALDQSIGRRVAGVLVDARIADPDVGEPEVEREIAAPLVLAADRQPVPVVIGKPR